MKQSKFFVNTIERFTQLSYPILFSLWLSLALIFSFAYFALSVFLPAHGPQPMGGEIWVKFINSIYYSVITATSTGYGDIVPQGISKLLAALQSISALMIFALFVTKLVSHKQEIALQEVHRLTYEDVFHNIREGLYIIRKDCDRIIEDANDNGKLTDDHWTDMTIIYQQAQTLIQAIPNFYPQDDETLELRGLYTIDPGREKLLHESVHRTLHRINEMLNALSRNGVPWTEHEESMVELHELVSTINVVTALWGKESPYTEAFEDIANLNDGIHDLVQRAIGQ